MGTTFPLLEVTVSALDAAHSEEAHPTPRPYYSCLSKPEGGLFKGFMLSLLFLLFMFNYWLKYAFSSVL
jgi:hypothetical protein